MPTDDDGQGDLFDEGLPDPGRQTEGFAHANWRGAPETERAAARLIAPRTGKARRKVLDAIAIEGGLVDEEIARVTGLRHYTAAPRRVELVRDGWIEDSGLRRKTTSGAYAAIWILTARGRAEWPLLPGSDGPPGDPPGGAPVPVPARPVLSPAAAATPEKVA